MTASRFSLQPQIDHLYADQPRRLAFQAKNPEEFASWKQELRSKVTQLLGLAGRPLPSSPQAESLQTIDRGDYIEEKLALDVGEGILAPIYLLIPKTPPPYKPILAFPGHGPGVQQILGNTPFESENHPQDSHYARSLAQAGYLVCAVEQRGFGERVSDQTQETFFSISCRHLSFEYLMQGRTLLGERCRDGMIALSYMLNREDVVKNRIGCTGHSGGGTTTLWLSALDERVSVAVVSCYFCSFQHSILGMHHCECNYVPGILPFAEMGDLAALIAPRPFRAIAGEHDPIFPVEAVRQQFKTVQKAYDVLDASDECSLIIHPDDHRYDFAASKDWFDRWL